MADKTTLVAYFSASGVTKRVAQRIADAAGADLFEIEPEEPYTSADLNWNDRNSRSSLENRDESIRPAVASALADAGAYDTVLLGFPIWWGNEPAVVDTFLEQNDFSGKTVVPFATSGGSGIAGAERSLARKYPGITWKRGALVNGSNAASWARATSSRPTARCTTRTASTTCAATSSRRSLPSPTAWTLSGTARGASWTW